MNEGRRWFSLRGYISNLRLIQMTDRLADFEVSNTLPDDTLSACRRGRRDVPCRSKPQWPERTWERHVAAAAISEWVAGRRDDDVRRARAAAHLDAGQCIESECDVHYCITIS